MLSRTLNVVLLYALSLAHVQKKTCKALTLTPTTTITVAFLYFFLLYFLFYLCSLRRCPTTLTARTESQMRNEQTRASAARRSAANASAKHFLSVCNEGRREEWREQKGEKRRVEREMLHTEIFNGSSPKSKSRG